MSPRHYFAIGTLAGITIFCEIALTRLFSVVQYYHGAFLAISVALFGFAVSGVFVMLRPERFGRERLDAAIARYGLLFSAAIPVAFFTYLYVGIGERLAGAGAARRARHRERVRAARPAVLRVGRVHLRPALPRRQRGEPALRRGPRVLGARRRVGDPGPGAARRSEGHAGREHRGGARHAAVPRRDAGHALARAGRRPRRPGLPAARPGLRVRSLAHAEVGHRRRKGTHPLERLLHGGRRAGDAEPEEPEHHHRQQRLHVDDRPSTAGASNSSPGCAATSPPRSTGSRAGDASSSSAAAAGATSWWPCCTAPSTCAPSR